MLQITGESTHANPRRPGAGFRVPSSRRRTASLVTLLLILLAGGLVASSASTLGGLDTEDLGAAGGITRQLTGVRLEWNPDSAGTLTSLRITAGNGQTFGGGDTVRTTVDGRDDDTCSASASPAAATSTLDLSFPGCALPLWQVDHVAVSVTGSGPVISPSGSIGLGGLLSSFDGAVVDPDANLTADAEIQTSADVQILTRLRLTVPGSTAAQLAGRRVIGVLTPADASAQPASYAGTIGTPENNDGIWAESAHGSATVVVDTTAGRPESTWPHATALVGYRLVLLQQQQLGQDQTYGVATIDGAVSATDPTPTDPDPTDPTPTDPTPTEPAPITVPAVQTGFEPVDLDSRLSVSSSGNPTLNNSLGYCYEVRVANTSAETVSWKVVFDTTKKPLWGMNPTTGGVSQMWNGQTTGYDPATGLWTIGGVDFNRTLAPGATTSFGYCATANEAPLHPSTYNAPQVSIDPNSNNWYVPLRVKVTSTSAWPVVWQAEVDLSTLVCAASLPDTLTGQNATLTRIDKTHYRLQGTTGPNTRYVWTNQSQDFVFTSYNPQGQPYRAGTC